jgi:regulator of sigma E protease
MDFLWSFFSFGHSALGYAVPFLIVLTIVVFFHELGHFLVARFFGVKIEAFSIGFGPELIGWEDRHETRWRISAIPLGGYVKFFGDETIASKPDASKKLEQYSKATRKQMFQFKPVGQRALIVLAGPLANFVLAVFIFSSLFMTVGKAIIEPRIGEIVAGSPAQSAGFQAHDLILSIDGQAIRSFSEVQRLVAMSGGSPMKIKVQRGPNLLELNVAPRLDTVNEKIGGAQKVWLIGLRSESAGGHVRYERYDPLTSLVMAVKETWFFMDRTLAFFHDLFTGHAHLRDLGGPIRIAQVSGDAAEAGPLALITLTALLSVSIGVLNLFPIPMLDGGHLMFYAIEAVRKRPLSEKMQEIGFRLGLAVVLTFAVLVTWNDLTRLLGL